MLIRQENNPSATSHHARLRVLEGTAERVDAEQPVLALQVGSQLDPGIERKHKPNEDTILVTRGLMPSASASPKPFALLMVVDGMGGQAHGQEASRLAVQALVASVTGSLGSQQMASEAFLPLLIAGVPDLVAIRFSLWSVVGAEERREIYTLISTAEVNRLPRYLQHLIRFPVESLGRLEMYWVKHG